MGTARVVVTWRRAAVVLAVSILTTAFAACQQEEAAPPEDAEAITLNLPGGATLEGFEQGGGSNVAILSHGATGEMDGYYELMPLLAEAGWRAIAYNAQGMGASTGQQGADRPGDLAAVVAYARDTGAERIALVGASQGAFVSLASSADVHADGVVALSAYDGGELPRQLGERIPVMLAVAEDNEPYASDVRALGEQLGVSPVFVTGDNHGTGMFDDHPELMDQVVAFLNEQVAGTHAAAGQ